MPRRKARAQGGAKKAATVPPLRAPPRLPPARCPRLEISTPTTCRSSRAKTHTPAAMPATPAPTGIEIGNECSSVCGGNRLAAQFQFFDEFESGGNRIQLRRGRRRRKFPFIAAAQEIARRNR